MVAQQNPKVRKTLVCEGTGNGFVWLEDGTLVADSVEADSACSMFFCWRGEQQLSIFIVTLGTMTCYANITIICTCQSQVLEDVEKS